MKTLFLLLFLVSCSSVPKGQIRYSAFDVVKVTNGFYKDCLGVLLKEEGNDKYEVGVICGEGNSPREVRSVLNASDFEKLRR